MHDCECLDAGELAQNLEEEAAALLGTSLSTKFPGFIIALDKGGPDPLPEQLLYWPFEGSLLDVIHGVPFYSVLDSESIPYIPAKYGYGLDLSAPTYFNHEFYDSLPSTFATWSLSFWCRLSEGSYLGQIVFKGPSNESITFFVINTEFYLFSGSAGGADPVTVNDGSPHFICVVASSGTATLFIDATPVASRTYNNAGAVQHWEYALGMDFGGDTGPYWIDDLALWNIALDSEQIDYLYNL